MSKKSEQRRFFRDVLPRLLEATAVWGVVAGVIGWVTWKELSRKPEAVETGREILFTAQEVRGVKANSPLICQGVVVGEVTSIEPQPDAGGTLRILIRADINAKFQNWAFESRAEVGSSGVAGAITGSPVELTFSGLLAENELSSLKAEPQRASLSPPEDTGKRIKRLLDEVETILSGFSAPVPQEEIPADWTAEEPPTRAELIARNLAMATDSLKSASMRLDHQMDAANNDSLMADLRGLKGNIDTLTGEAESLLTTIRETIDSIDGKMTDLLGATPEERGRLRDELEQMLGSATGLLDQVNQILPRVGDTFLGRMIIRRKDGEEVIEEEAAENAAIPSVSGGRRR